MTPEENYKRILKECRKDPKVLALFPTAGRPKGFYDKHSDWDFFIIVKDDKEKQYQKEYPFEGFKDLHISVMGLKKFKNYLKWDEIRKDDYYNFAYSKAVFDKTKKLQKLVNACITIPESKVKDRTYCHLCKYTNMIYRTFKNHKGKNTLASRMDGIEALQHFLEAAFNLHQGKIRPYNKFLEWEIKKGSLRRLNISPVTLTRNLRKIVKNNDIDSHKKLFKAIEKIARKDGYGKIFDDWTHDLDFMHNYKP